MLIGLSVGTCFPDMVVGEVDPAHVDKIIGRTKCPVDEIDDLVRHYREFEWSYRLEDDYQKPTEQIKGLLDEVEALFRKFFAEGRLEQPRLTKGTYPDIDKMGTYWVHDENKIEWTD
ncbi:MAG: hypothetical protein G01um101448_1225 [Parcubacteria group bacterium Gr01-1014_48]|nr:MAG: hypothetical protein Greene041614_503 [Parcubacteria group bacterium Greene0416_14]TSC71329.1 MAG: hypothetical protein G01um101448_1225 [Parcubacteria group bacterium Gr01-1014_48]TSD01676.1 MAG: hypothetical protein Greene101415_74 [Parcubacteria group bacterium Greene1014_15]TSD07820.1 MAG: hypothetical protein Greene07144_692 [Parcubacteria group bacterium Greene0714_4]